ncbi:MAG: flagellar assembly protein FliW [Campylobacterota bacterium]
MYNITLPLLGFEDNRILKVNKIDNYFSSLVLNETQEISFTVVNISYLEHAAFDFTIDDKILKKMEIAKREDFDIYFSVVLQEPIEKSIVNLVAPILINNKSKLAGQFIIKDDIPNIFTNLRP